MVHLGHDDYVGLHRRYQQMLGGFEPVITLSDDERSKIQQRLSKAFRGMMSALFRQKGATLDIHILTSGEAQHFISTHASILDSTFSHVRMSDTMRRRLTDSDYIFSGIKTFHELNEAFPSLLDENGVRKPFERFLNDVQSIDKTYNQHYLRAEYNFAHASASMAAKWEQIAGDGDRYNLQYRTAGDDHVRPEHAALAGVTLPPSDPFWASYYPPNGWNCRCTAVQVRRDKYPETPHDEAMNRGEEALKNDKKGFFRFNSGIARKTFPDYNPYTIRRCRDCDIAKGKASLAFVPENELCAACSIVRKCYGDKTKSARAIERTHYLHEMEPLLKKSAFLKTDDKDKMIKVKFTKLGNKHLFSDTFRRSKVLRKEDLKNLDSLLQKAQFIESSALTHPRNDGIDKFYYYRAKLHGEWVRLNVGRDVQIQDNGKKRVIYFLYSINDIKK